MEADTDCLLLPAPLEDMAYYMAWWGREVGREVQKAALSEVQIIRSGLVTGHGLTQEGILKPQALATSLAGLYAIAFVVERLSS